MTYKEWNAVVQIVSALIVGGWVIWDFANGGAVGLDMAGVAMKLVWVIVAAIAFNIVAIIILTIVVSIARREEFKDERADERDRLVADKSHRNGYLATSIAAGLSLVALAFGLEPTSAAYALFGAPMLGGTIEAISRLVYYRIG